MIATILLATIIQVIDVRPYNKDSNCIVSYSQATLVVGVEPVPYLIPHYKQITKTYLSLINAVTVHKISLITILARTCFFPILKNKRFFEMKSCKLEIFEKYLDVELILYFCIQKFRN